MWFCGSLSCLKKSDVFHRETVAQKVFQKVLFKKASDEKVVAAKIASKRHHLAKNTATLPSKSMMPYAEKDLVHHKNTHCSKTGSGKNFLCSKIVD